MTYRIAVTSSKQSFAKVRRFLPGIGEQIALEYIENPSRLLVSRDHLLTPNLFIYEINQSPGKAVDLVAELVQRKQLAVMVMTAKPDWKTARDFAKLGVTNYFHLPDDIHQLVDAVEFMMSEWSAQQQAVDMLEFQRDSYGFDKVITQSPIVMEAIEKARTAGKQDSLPVLLCGEPGAGKEFLAKVIHYNSARCEEPFVDITCSGIPEITLEAELFGYERGAFHEAREARRGLLEITGRGTIFLDEISSLSLYLQAKLLKAIKQKRFRRVGGAREYFTDVRIIAATDADLDARVAAGKFSSGLYFQLNVMRIDLPSLDKRGEDIPLLTDFFIQSFNELHGKAIAEIAQPARDMLLQHDWTGNVKELRHAIERAVILAKENVLQPHDFQFLFDRTLTQAVQEKPEEEVPPGGDVITLQIPLERGSLDEVEKQFVEEVLRMNEWNKSRAAGLLKISRPKLDRMIHKFQIAEP